MTRRTLREQLVDEWAGPAASEDRAAIVAARIRASVAERRDGRRGFRVVAVAVAAAVLAAASVMAAVALLREDAVDAIDPEARVLAASEAWLGFRPIVPAELEDWRLVGLRREVVDGVAGVRIDLVNRHGRSAVVVETPLRVPAGGRVRQRTDEAESIEGLRVQLQGTTMTARREGNLLVASAEPSDAEPTSGTVRRSGEAVVLTRADRLEKTRAGGLEETRAGGLEETTMMNVHSRDAAFRLARAALAALALTAGSAGATPAVTADVAGSLLAPAPARPQLLAVKFHANWCPVCQKMGTIFDDLARRLADRPVQFVELDFTDDTTRRQARYLAAALGIDSVVHEQGRGVGFILLIDADSRRVVGRLTGDLTLDELARGTTEVLGTL